MDGMRLAIIVFPAPGLPIISKLCIPAAAISAALRTARDLDAGEAEWMRFVDELKKRKG